MEHRTRLYLISLGAALSASGSQISQLAISAKLFEIDPSGTMSSQLVVLHLLGVAIFGVAGGWILQKFSAPKAGLLAPLLAGALSLGLFLNGSASAPMYLAVAFMQSLLFGAEHPNMMRFIHSQLPMKERASYFSFVQSAQQTSLLCAPAIAVALIHSVGVRWCFLIDAGSYLFSAMAWLSVQSTAEKTNSQQEPKKQGSFFDGYTTLLQHSEVRSLGLFRIFNHFAYTTFMAALPLWAARIAVQTSLQAADLQAAANTSLAVGTIGISLLGGAILKKSPHWIVRFPLLSSCLGFFAVAAVSIIPCKTTLLFSGLVIGLGQYFFRLTGIVIGSAVTPAPLMASVILAGDTITRGASFALGSLVPFLFECSNAIPWTLPFASLALLAPWLARHATASATLPGVPRASN